MLLDIRTMSKHQQRGWIMYLIIMAMMWPIILLTDEIPRLGFASLIVLGMSRISEAFNLKTKNRLETLYAMLPSTRNDIIISRYLFAICMMLIVSLLALPYSLITSTQKMIGIMAGILICALYLSILYPLFFKWNSLKAYSFIDIGFGMLVLLIVIKLPNDALAGIVQAAPIISSLLMALSGCILIYLSYLLSCKIYRKRDLEIGHYKNNAIKKGKFYKNCEKKTTGLYSINKIVTLMFLNIRGTKYNSRFYVPLPLTRGDIVKSHYLLSISVLTVVIFIILALLLGDESQYLYFIMAAVFPMPILIMSLSYPCQFKWGYHNMWFLQLIEALTVPVYRPMIKWGHHHARWIPPFVSGMAFVFFFLIVGLVAIFIIKNGEKINAGIAANPVMIFSLLYGGSLILFYSSYRLSCRFYEKRDL